MYTVVGLAKVIEIISPEEDLVRIILIRYQNGTTNLITTIDYDLELGDVILIENGSTNFEKVDSKLWFEPLKTGTFINETSNNKARILFQNNIYEIEFNNTLNIKRGNIIVFTFDNGVQDILNFNNTELTSDTLSIENYIYDPSTITETFDDYGGNSPVIERTKELINISLFKKRELEELGTKPIKGVLFSGPPGTGKTMLARIIAKEVNASFYHINGPEIFTKYYGDSEKILRLLFDDAQTKDKSIIFFDELDSIASKRKEDSHEVSKRVVTQLLTLMDGFNKKSDVLIIATTNKPEDIDSALRRPGRFDWEIKFNNPRTVEERIKILQASSRKIKIADNIHFSKVAELTDNWSAAELVSIWNEAGLLAIQDYRTKIYNEDFIEGFNRVYTRKQSTGDEHY